MDTQELYRRGVAVRKQIFGADAVEQRMGALGEFGAPLQHMINAYAYGDIWSRPGLERKIRSLVVLGMNAAINRAASEAGYPGWWLTDHVTESIAFYLRLRNDENVVAFNQLAETVQYVLKIIGYKEIVPYFTPAPPPVYRPRPDPCVPVTAIVPGRPGG